MPDFVKKADIVFKSENFLFKVENNKIIPRALAMEIMNKAINKKSAVIALQFVELFLWACSTFVKLYIKLPADPRVSSSIFYLCGGEVFFCPVGYLGLF